MKRIFSFLASLIILNSWASIAHATGSDSSTFLLNPSTVLTTSQWPTAYNNIAVLPRNVYWNFNKSPFIATAGNQDATYHGTLDGSTTSGNTFAGDSFTSTGGVAWTNATTQEVGVSGNGTTGTAVYSFNTSALSNSNDNHTIYIWAEINVSDFKGSVDFSNLTNVTSSELFNESTKAEVGTSAIGTLMTTGTYDAYFKIVNPSSTEALTLSFADQSGSSSNVFINSLHIAVTPEPMAMALFATGVGVLFFFRRRMGLQLA